mgnify:CR=1 FL=1
MFIKREYSIKHFQNNVFSDDFVLITSNITNSRSQVFINEFPNIKYIDVEYQVKMGSDNVLKDEFSVNTNFTSELQNTEYKSLYKELRTFIQILHNETKKIIIDISSFHLRFLGAFLSALTEWEWQSIICAYTEITAYPREMEKSPIDGEKVYSVGFDLNSSFWGYNEIPNLKTTTSERGDYIWIAFLGFEGKRAAAVYTEISDDTNTTIPVITMPSVKPGWSNYAFDANQFLFENAKLYGADIRYINALDPFATYNLIEEVKKENPNRHIVLSPLGTRPVSLGVLLYALRHEESEVYFDTPKESCSKIISSGRIHIYDILSFFEE